MKLFSEWLKEDCGCSGGAPSAPAAPMPSSPSPATPAPTTSCHTCGAFLPYWSWMQPVKKKKHKKKKKS